MLTLMIQFTSFVQPTGGAVEEAAQLRITSQWLILYVKLANTISKPHTLGSLTGCGTCDWREFDSQMLTLDVYSLIDILAFSIFAKSQIVHLYFQFFTLLTRALISVMRGSSN